MNTHLKAGITCALLAAASTASANPQYTFGGYGTLAATRANIEDNEYRSSWRQNKGSDGSFDLGVDSRLGVQGTALFNDMFSATAQPLAIRRDGKETVNVEWLYAQAHITDALSARAGRIVLPAFMLSDSRNVGYSQHWVRMLMEAYLGFPVTSVDGVQVTFRTKVGGTIVTVQPTLGEAKARMYFDLGPFLGQGTAEARMKKLGSLNLTAEHGDWTFRLGHTVTLKASLEYVSHPFIQVPAFRDAFTGLGLQYDDGSLLVMSEYVLRKTTGKVLDTKSYYISGGYRFGPWMPYVTHARQNNTGLVIADRPDVTTNALGVRWDVYKNTALKSQIERTNQAGEHFTKINPPGKKVSVLTLAVDFVF